jgi:hypothetical protein
MSGSARALGVAFTLAVWAGVGVPTAHAQDSAPDSAVEARQQYQDGTKAFSGKRYSEAALHFEAAASFKANAVALYTAALAWDLASRPERAADAYARALEVPGLDTKQTGIAKDRVATLEKTLGTLAVTGVEGTKVQLDTLSEVAVPGRLHAQPGVHVLSVRAPGKPIERRDVALDAGKTTSLELKEEKKPPPKPNEPEPEPPPPKVTPKGPEPLPPRLREQQFWTTPKAVGVGVLGVGLAAIATGAILGTSAEGAKDAYNAAPTQPGYDHAKSLETLTNVTFVVGALLTAGGVALLVIPIGERNEGKVNVGVAPGGLTVGGGF